MILAISLLVGGVAAVLTFVASRSAPVALLAEGTATGGAIGLLNEIVGDDPSTG